MLEQAAQFVAVTKPKNLHKLAEKKHLKKEISKYKKVAAAAVLIIF